MLNKRAIAFQVLVIMIIALVVLSAVLMFWSGSVTKLFGGANDITDTTNKTVSDTTKMIIKSEIEMKCGSKCLDPNTFYKDKDCRICVCGVLKGHGMKGLDINGDKELDIIC